MMDQTTYQPQPIDTTAIEIPASLQELVEMLASHVHATWAEKRIADGWVWGPERDDDKKHHPDLVPYDQLPESEKQYDRTTAEETIKVVLRSGYKIEKKHVT
jgi:hypothetical protein